MSHGSIASLLARASRAIDEYDVEALRDCFTDDAEFVLVTTDGNERVNKGPEVPDVLVRGAQRQGGRLRHVVLSVASEEVGPNRVVAKSYTVYVAVGHAEILGISESIDELERQADGWKLASRRVVLLSELR